MASTTLSIRVETETKKRLEKLAKVTARSRSFLAAEAIDQYIEVNAWQVAGIKQAMSSLDNGRGVAHDDVRAWVESWGQGKERRRPRAK